VHLSDQGTIWLDAWQAQMIDNCDLMERLVYAPMSMGERYQLRDRWKADMA